MESLAHEPTETTAVWTGQMGIERALERVYRDKLEAFVRVASAIVGNREVGCDAVQEGFARALAHGELRRERSLEAWVWRIVVNEARRRAASRSRSPGSVPDVPEDCRPDDAAWLRGVVATLPDRQRTVLFLRYYADLEYDAIAEAIGVAPGTVAATLSQARSSLRRKLEEAGDGV
jgi:RNA polymerase sigma factor (sigma-70 family)